MSKKIYTLRSNLDNFPFFVEKSKVDKTFKSEHFKWKKYNKKTYVFELVKNSTSNKKNYNFDISREASNLIVFSKKAVDVLKDILEKTGTFVDIKIDNNNKQFYGFYPNKNIYSLDIIDLNTTNYRMIGKEYLFYKIKLNGKAPIDDYLFALEEYSTGAYVTDKFKKIVEDNGLVGFDFTEVVYEK